MPAAELKIISDNGSSFRVGGYAVVWNGQDVVKDFFTPFTDFWFDKLTHTPPVMYQHTGDDFIGDIQVGRVVTKTVDDVGLWVEAQITAAKKYAEAIRDLVKKGILGFSSGSVPHLVRRTKTADGRHQITVWPFVELSLTPTPAEPRTIGVKELKAIVAREPAIAAALSPAKATSLVEDSYEDMQDDLGDAASAVLGGMCCVVATYADHVIVCQMNMGDSDGELWDIPYTVGPDKEPVLGTPAPVQRAFVDDMADRSAKATNIVSADSPVATAAKGGPMPNDLPDEAFAYIEPGGVKESGLTTPRSYRHFLHHAEDGNVDPALLASAIAEAKSSVFKADVMAHLLAHERGRQDAHTKFWSADSAVGQLLVIFSEGIDLMDEIVEAQKSMDLLGYEKSAARIRPEPGQRLTELKKALEAVLAHATQAESGDDGTARAEYLRRRLALVEV